MGSGVAALMETNRLLGPQRLPSPACKRISPPCTTPREKPPGRSGLERGGCGVHGDCRGETSGSTFAYFRARPVLQGNERRLACQSASGRLCPTVTRGRKSREAGALWERWWRAVGGGFPRASEGPAPPPAPWPPLRWLCPLLRLLAEETDGGRVSTLRVA